MGNTGRRRISWPAVALAAVIGAGVIGAFCLLAAWLGADQWLLRAAGGTPPEGGQALFNGIHYRVETRSAPRPMVIHIVSIDLRTPGLSFLVTPGDPDAELPLNARTTSQFLEEFGVQAAINGDGATPWHSNTPFDYYPHVGDPVTPIGLAASQGVIYSQPTDAEPTLYISKTNRARIGSPAGRVYNAISGNRLLVKGGRSALGGDLENDVPQPRTAVGLDQRARWMYLVVVDGRQPGYSEGAALADLAEIFIELGAHTALNLDGGGSSTLVVEGSGGRAQVLNRPIDSLIPGRERPVGNHLGIFAPD